MLPVPLNEAHDIADTSCVIHDDEVIDSFGNVVESDVSNDDPIA